jgi:hypothetical protein|tara:strand:+ start:83 stop:346 length:264 start_codon:yes stop_codon:yes gene_type:complete
MNLHEAQLKSFIPRSQLLKIWPNKKLRYNETIGYIIDYLIEFMGEKDDNPRFQTICLELGLISTHYKMLTKKGSKILYFGLKTKYES